jgi:hypothetical protein
VTFQDLMSTPPITQRIAVRVRRRRLARSVPARIAWRAADLVAIAACATLALRGLL